MMAWFLLIPIALLFFMTLLVAVPLGLLALAASPDVRRTAKRAATAVAPVALVGLGLAFFLSVPQRAQLAATPSEYPDRPVPVDRPIEASSLPAPATLPSAGDARAATDPRPIVQQDGSADREELVLWLRIPVMIGVLGLTIGAVLATVRTGKIRWLLGPAGVLLVCSAGGLALANLKQQLAESAHRAEAQSHLLTSAEMHHTRTLAAETEARATGAWPVSDQTTAADRPDPLVPVAITAFVGETTPGNPVQQLPDWVTAEPLSDLQADTERFVLQSARYASVEEADAELLGRLRPPLDVYLQKGNISLDVQDLSLAEIQRAHIRTSRVVEQFDLPLKSSVEPVYRATWQVSLRPVVRDTLGAEYRLAGREGRLWDVTLGVGLLTLLFGIWAAYFRVDDSTQGRYRGRLALAAAGASLAEFAAVLVV